MREYCVPHFLLRNYMSLFIKKIFSLFKTITFWSFCTPHHWRTWWLRWKLGIATRSYWRKYLAHKHVSRRFVWVCFIESSVSKKWYKKCDGVAWHNVISMQNKLAHHIIQQPCKIIKRTLLQRDVYSQVLLTNRLLITAQKYNTHDTLENVMAS